MKRPKPITVAVYLQNEFEHWFQRANITPAPFYVLLRELAPTAPYSGIYLLIPIQDPVYKFVLWNVEQVPTDPRRSASNGVHYFIQDYHEFWLTSVALADVIRAIGTDSFYDIFEFPEPETAHHDWTNKLYRP